MSNFLIDQAEAYRYETFRCGQCRRDFTAKVITWVDVSRAPQAQKALLQQEFNMIQCVYCGSPHLAEVPFFYEDFEEGLLVAVFPRAPENSDALEAQIRDKYGYYPHLEFFYDMTRLWLLISLQKYYRGNSNPRSFAMTGSGDKQTLKLLRFLKKDPVMAAIKEKLDDIFSGADEDDENLAAALGQAIYRFEGLHPWPLDRRCVCKAIISPVLTCCGRRIDFDNHEILLLRNRSFVCPTCGKHVTHAVCKKCGRTYTWELGIVESFEGGEDIEHLFSRVHGSLPHAGGGGM